MPEAEYHARPELSASIAKRLIAPGGPARWKWEREHGRRETKAFDTGHAAHKVVLGVGAELAVIPDAILASNGAASTKDAKAFVAEARERGAVPLKQTEYDMVQGMALALWEHREASRLLSEAGTEVELSAFATQTGVALRCRWDAISDAGIVDYKGLAIDTPIPTPGGWKYMADIEQGDEVFDSQGNPCRVIHKSETHWRTCYKITFDDGSSVVCDDEHRWVTQSVKQGGSSVKTTIQILKTLRHKGQRQHRIPITGSLRMPEAELPIDPYVLGCWLGDGNSANGRISKPDTELFELIEDRGWDVAPIGAPKQCPTRTVYGLTAKLRELGLLNNKHIPQIYLRGSAQQRLDLLRGLMDTDGSWNDLRTQAVFTTTDPELAEGVRELALSLGQRGVTIPYVAHGFGKELVAYHVNFRPIGINPFLLSRKADRVRIAPTIQSSTRLIRSVEKVPTVPTQCIEVDSADHTYLCTKAMIPTHNTSYTADPARWVRDAAKLGQHLSAAHYRWMAQHLEITDGPLRFIVQEKTAPYLVSVIRLDESAELLGAQRMREAIDIWQEAHATGIWPGYGETEHLISLPDWAYPDDMEMEIEL